MRAAEAVERIDVDAKSYGEIILSGAANENASAIIIGPVGGTTTRVAYRVANDDPWFECVRPPSHARHRWIHHLLTERGVTLRPGESVEGSFVQKQANGPSLIWHAQAKSPNHTIMMTRGNGGAAS